MPDLRIWSQRELTKLKRDIDRLFDDFCSDFDLPRTGSSVVGGIRFRMDDTRLLARLRLPEGMDSDDIAISVNDDVMVIEGRHQMSGPGVSGTQVFRKRVNLPCRIRPEDVKASFRESMLEIEMPRCGCSTVRTIRIEKG